VVLLAMAASGALVRTGDHAGLPPLSERTRVRCPPRPCAAGSPSHRRLRPRATCACRRPRTAQPLRACGSEGLRACGLGALPRARRPAQG